MKRVLVLHGPNLKVLNWGNSTLVDLNRQLRRWARINGCKVLIFQSNSEGKLLDMLHARRKWAEGVVLSPSSLSLNSYSLRDAISAVNVPTVEVQWEELPRPQKWKKASVLAPVCRGLFVGEGFSVYEAALERLRES